MEHSISSEYPTRLVTDLTFRFLNGSGYTVRLVDGVDEYEVTKDAVLLTLRKDKNSNPSQFQTIERRNLLHFVEQVGVIETVYPPGHSPAELKAAELELARARKESERSEERLNRRLDKLFTADRL